MADNKDDKKIVKKKETGSEPITPDSSKKDKDKFIPKHRFDEINSELKELRAWRKEQEEKTSKAEEAQLKEQKKFEELAEKRKVERDAAVKKAEEMQINNLIQTEATKVGIKDLDAVTKLIDRAGIEVKDDEVKGIEEAVKGLLESKPYLKDAEANEPSLGAGSSPPDKTSKPVITKFKASQLQDPKFFAKHEEEISKAMGIPGAIEDDVGIGQDTIEGPKEPAATS